MVKPLYEIISKTDLSSSAVVVGINDMIKQQKFNRLSNTSTEEWIESDHSTPLVVKHDNFGLLLTQHIQWVMSVVEEAANNSKEFWTTRTTAILHEGDRSNVRLGRFEMVVKVSEMRCRHHY